MAIEISYVKSGMFRKVLIFCCMLVSCISVNGYQIRLENDGPIVGGATINFTATVFDGNDLATGLNLKYYWVDEAIHRHTRQVEKENATDSWMVTYNASVYPFGEYTVQVTVEKCIVWDTVCYGIGSARNEFKITETLNGALRLEQKNRTRTNEFVSNMETVIHAVDLKKSDLEYINTAPTVLTYWFVDCTYYGITTDFKFPFNYSMADESHFVEALVMADFTPIAPTTTIPPTTTTLQPNSTTTPPTTVKPNNTTPLPTTIKPTSTSILPSTTTLPSTTQPNSTTKSMNTSMKPNSSTQSTLNASEKTTSGLHSTSTYTEKSVVKRSIDNSTKGTNTTSNILVLINGNLVPYNISFPYVCNGSRLSSDPMKVYGVFFKRVVVKAPLGKINVVGNNWIQPGDLLSLKISCTGSKNIDYCVKYVSGEYNVTGNETCGSYTRLDTCDFRIKRYLLHPKTTIVIIIKNEVSKIVTPVTVNIYKVNKQAQLSVIVVPVAFSLVAVVLIVFGVAYYIQNRSRFIIEVADFNFGQQYSDMEYKSFRERLRDSFAYAFSRGPSPGSSEVPVWPPGQKYGSMK